MCEYYVGRLPHISIVESKPRHQDPVTERSMTVRPNEKPLKKRYPGQSAARSGGITA